VEFGKLAREIWKNLPRKTVVPNNKTGREMQSSESYWDWIQSPR